MYLKTNKTGSAFKPSKIKNKNFAAYQDNSEIFMSMANHLATLLQNGEISEDTFKAVIRHTAPSFIEAEVSKHVNSIMEDIDSIFQNKTSLNMLMGLL